MGKRILWVACLIVVSPAFAEAGGRDTFKDEMRFGAQAAQQGLWREAAFRWEKILKDHPDVVKNFLWPSGRHDPDVFFANIQGRVMRTADAGVTWTPVNGLRELDAAPLRSKSLPAKTPWCI